MLSSYQKQWWCVRHHKRHTPLYHLAAKTSQVHCRWICICQMWTLHQFLLITIQSLHQVTMPMLQRNSNNYCMFKQINMCTKQKWRCTSKTLKTGKVEGIDSILALYYWRLWVVTACKNYSTLVMTFTEQMNGRRTSRYQSLFLLKRNICGARTCRH